MSEKKEIIKSEDAVTNPRETRTVIPSVDIYENTDEILVHAEMPGVKKEDVSVQIEKNTLVLSGLRRIKDNGKSDGDSGLALKYVRRFRVPKRVDGQGAVAELKDGVLTLHLPKFEAVKPRMIEIKAA